MLYHCLRRRPNIKTTLRRRFVFDAITTVISMLICSIWKVLLFVSSTLILTGQDSFMGFFRHVHQCANIHRHSDPENPEQIPKNMTYDLAKS